MKRIELWKRLVEEIKAKTITCPCAEWSNSCLSKWSFWAKEALHLEQTKALSVWPTIASEERVEDGDDAILDFEDGTITAWILVMCSWRESDDLWPRNMRPQWGHRAWRMLRGAAVSPMRETSNKSDFFYYSLIEYELKIYVKTGIELRVDRKETQISYKYRYSVMQFLRYNYN